MKPRPKPKPKPPRGMTARDSGEERTGVSRGVCLVRCHCVALAYLVLNLRRLGRPSESSHAIANRDAECGQRVSTGVCPWLFRAPRRQAAASLWSVGGSQWAVARRRGRSVWNTRCVAACRPRDWLRRTARSLGLAGDWLRVVHCQNSGRPIDTTKHTSNKPRVFWLVLQSLRF
ncbi:hypothetical protein BT67DRAFT_83463 [Trichocladium antarcticum]|uniref:Uncharacterized protein n=1 Tax=Trichocladium antarcticum TaxID=1450529 RepID=A0AAN6ZCD5_9PEZI|nr:hypothetical protein BT67DRAFT_83463 [Trichocladium antarcticum]